MSEPIINSGGPAFPRPPVFKNECVFDPGNDGMTLRDYFAAAALQALVTRDGSPYDSQLPYVVWSCYRLADAMLAAREERE